MRGSAGLCCTPQAMPANVTSPQLVIPSAVEGSAVRLSPSTNLYRAPASDGQRNVDLDRQIRAGGRERLTAPNSPWGIERLPAEPLIIWRPRRDLNPCYRRERAVSWAGLDDGDAGCAQGAHWPGTANSTLSRFGNHRCPANAVYPSYVMTGKFSSGLAHAVIRNWPARRFAAAYPSPNGGARRLPL